MKIEKLPGFFDVEFARLALKGKSIGVMGFCLWGDTPQMSKNKVYWLLEYNNCCDGCGISDDAREYVEACIELYESEL